MRKTKVIVLIILLLAALFLALFPAPVLASSPWGLASQYDLGVMPRVVANRLAWGQLPRLSEATVFVAGPDCEEIGRLFWIRPQNWQRQGRAWEHGLHGAFNNYGWERAIIADCPGDWQAANFLATLGRPIEIGGETVARWGYPRGRGVPVEVVWRGLPVELKSP